MVGPLSGPNRGMSILIKRGQAMERQAVHFDPWQGEMFGRAASPLGAKRLLVLGEAHYSEHQEDEIPSLTQSLVEDLRTGKRSIGYFTKLANLLSVHRSGSQPRDVWDSIAFYNFVQGFAAEKARERPSAEMWDAGRAPFARVLAELAPERVLVTGVELWNALSNGLFPGWTSRSTTEGSNGPIYEWTSVDREQHVRSTWINHPSSVGFAYEDWVARVDALLN